MAKRKWSPRINIEITEEQYFALQKLPWGTKSALFGVLVGELADIIEVGGINDLIKLAEGKCRLKIVAKED